MRNFLHYFQLTATLHKRERANFIETHLPPPTRFLGNAGKTNVLLLILFVLAAWLAPGKACAIDRHEGFELSINGAKMEFAYVDKTKKTVELASSTLPADSILVIPSSVEYEGTTYRVSKVASRGNSYSLPKNAKKIIIEEGIERIGTDFNGIKIIQSLRLPATIREIPAKTFYRTTVDTIIWDTEEEVTIGEYAFHGSKIKHFVLPDNTTKIGSGAFAESNIKSITLPKGLKDMGAISYVNPFYGCKELVEIKSESPNYKVIDGVLYNSVGGNLICYPAYKKEHTFNLPPSVRIIAQNAFFECESLRTVNFNKDFLTIAEKAFYSCPNLTTVNFNEELISIGTSAFQHCRKLESVVLSRECLSVYDYAFASTDITSVRLNKKLKKIGSWVFKNCDSLASVATDDYDAKNFAPNFAHQKLIVLPKSLEYLGDCAFRTEQDMLVERPKRSWYIALCSDNLNYYGGQAGDTVFIYGNGKPNLANTGYAYKATALYIPFDQYDYYNALYKDNERSRPLQVTEYAPIFFNNTVVTEKNYKNIVWKGMNDGASASYDIATKTLKLDNVGVKSGNLSLMSFQDGLTIDVGNKITNTFTTTGSSNAPTVRLYGNTTFIGSGNITIRSNNGPALYYNGCNVNFNVGGRAYLYGATGVQGDYTNSLSNDNYRKYGTLTIGARVIIGGTSGGALNGVANLKMNGVGITSPYYASYNQRNGVVYTDADKTKVADTIQFDNRTYSIWVGNTQVSSANADNIPAGEANEGRVSYDAGTNTLILDNATITAPQGTEGIKFTASANIKLIGKNTINTSGAWGDGICIAGKDTKVEIDGGEDLTINADKTNGSSAIELEGQLIIRNANITITGKKGVVGKGGYNGETFAIYSPSYVVINTKEEPVSAIKTLTLRQTGIASPTSVAFDASKNALCQNGAVYKGKVTFGEKTNYHVRINYKSVTSLNANNMECPGLLQGKISYDHASRTLTLDNIVLYDSVGNRPAILFTDKADYTVRIVGDCKIQNFGDGLRLNNGGTITLDGDGMLTITKSATYRGATPITLSDSTTLVVKNIALTMAGNGDCVFGDETGKMHVFGSASIVMRNTSENSYDYFEGIYRLADVMLTDGAAVLKPNGASYDKQKMYIVGTDGKRITSKEIVIANPATYQSDEQIPVVEVTEMSSSEKRLIFRMGDTWELTGEGNGATGVYSAIATDTIPQWISTDSLENTKITDVYIDDDFRQARPTRTSYWFYNCSNLAYVSGLENLNTDLATNFASMFRNCKRMSSLDLSALSFASATNINSLAAGCSNLRQLSLGEFDVSDEALNNSKAFEGVGSKEQPCVLNVSETFDYTLLGQAIDKDNTIYYWQGGYFYSQHHQSTEPNFDITNDGEVNSADIVAIYSYISTGEASGYTLEQVDLNNDNLVSGADIVALYNKIAGSTAESKRYILRLFNLTEE